MTDPSDDTDWIPDGHEFALCLTHDVDRPYKTYQAVYYAVGNRDPSSLLDLLPGRNPYWTFPTIQSIEADLGVRSAFYFLDEQSLFADRPPSEWFTTRAWQLYAGRYDLADPAIGDLIGDLERGGWEVGLHGSYEAVDDTARLKREKAHLESITAEPIRGGRQHYFRFERPDTWRHYRRIGLSYDATYGDPTTVGFDHGYEPIRPFYDGFVSFPITLMERALPDPSVSERTARRTCERLLEEAATEGAVTTVLWHPRYFCERDHPGFTSLYRHLIETALEMGAWVGTPGDLYDRTMKSGTLKTVDRSGNGSGEATDVASTEKRTDRSGSNASEEPVAGP